MVALFGTASQIAPSRPICMAPVRIFRKAVPLYCVTPRCARRLVAMDYDNVVIGRRCASSKGAASSGLHQAVPEGKLAPE
jgi:hypothetical protein